MSISPAFKEMLVVLRNIVGKPEANGDWPDPYGFEEDFTRARAAIVLAEDEIAGPKMVKLGGKEHSVVGLTNCDRIDDDMAI